MHLDVLKHAVVEVTVVVALNSAHAVAAPVVAEGSLLFCWAIKICAVCKLLFKSALIHECEALELVLHCRAERRAVGVHATSEGSSTGIERR